MVEGDGYPYRYGDQVIAESEVGINGSRTSTGSEGASSALRTTRRRPIWISTYFPRRSLIGIGRVGSRPGVWFFRAAVVDSTAIADAWRARYQLQMEMVRSGRRPWLNLDVLATGRGTPHPFVHDSPGLAERRIANDADVIDVIALMRLNYDRIVARHGLPGQASTVPA
jgi:hypothetical protein